MSDQDFVYGIFSDSKSTISIVEQLRKAGLASSQVCVVGGNPEYKYVSGQIKDPTAKYFLRFGIAGLLCGLVAGIAAAPHIPYAATFEILVPLMAAISGGVVFAYFGTMMCAFLLANNPHHWASVFEGTVENGEVIIAAEPVDDQQRKLAIQILDSHRPVELILRRKPLSQLAPKDHVEVETPITPALKLPIAA